MSMSNKMVFALFSLGIVVEVVNIVLTATVPRYPFPLAALIAVASGWCVGVTIGTWIAEVL